MAPVRTDPSRWIRRALPRPEAAVRLFCFAHSGGGASTFRRWAALLPAAVDVCAIQLPGREDRLSEPPLTCFSDVVDLVTDVIAADKPFAFLGHSIGGLLAFEVARRLVRSGEPGPCVLFASGSASPDVKDPDPPISGLPDDRFIDELRRLNGTPDVVLRDPELMELLLPTVRADFEMYESYRFADGRPIAAPIVVFGGIQDVRTPAADLDRWSAHTTGRFARHMFPGDHFFIQTSQAEVVQAVERELRRSVHDLDAQPST
jgi:medium-chain acyl-[acyl-carrier-protein] hydrolase